MIRTKQTGQRSDSNTNPDSPIIMGKVNGIVQQTDAPPSLIALV